MKNTIRITKSFKFETGHALYGHDGLCKNIHGHSYKLFVTVMGSLITAPNHPKSGMVMDFSDLKKIVNETIVDAFDHATVLNIDSPHRELADQLEKYGHKLVRTAYQPTSEMMLLDFAEKLKDKLPHNVKLFALKLNETETAFAEWYAADQH